MCCILGRILLAFRRTGENKEDMDAFTNEAASGDYNYLHATLMEATAGRSVPQMTLADRMRNMQYAMVFRRSVAFFICALMGVSLLSCGRVSRGRSSGLSIMRSSAIPSAYCGASGGEFHARDSAGCSTGDRGLGTCRLGGFNALALNNICFLCHRGQLKKRTRKGMMPLPWPGGEDFGRRTVRVLSCVIFLW